MQWPLLDFPTSDGRKSIPVRHGLPNPRQSIFSNPTCQPIQISRMIKVPAMDRKNLVVVRESLHVAMIEICFRARNLLTFARDGTAGVFNVRTQDVKKLRESVNRYNSILMRLPSLERKKQDGNV